MKKSKIEYLLLVIILLSVNYAQISLPSHPSLPKGLVLAAEAQLQIFVHQQQQWENHRAAPHKDHVLLTD